jgi:hypothetical protein
MLAPVLLLGAGLAVVVAQIAVSQRASGPPPVQSQSLRYGGGGLLPSEQRYVKWRSGQLPSEYRNQAWSSGSLPSQGRIAGPPGANASLRYPSYNMYYNRTANSMSPAYNTYTQHTRNYSHTPSIRYGGSRSVYTGSAYRVNTQVNYQNTGTYKFHQNYNSYHQVSAKPRSLNYRPPSIRYGTFK